MEQLTLRNGVRMPILGYGTLKLPQDSCAACVAQAIGHGYRLIDTAKNYVNEEQVDEGIRRSGIDRMDKGQPMIGNPQNPALVESSAKW